MYYLLFLITSPLWESGRFRDAQHFSKLGAEVKLSKFVRHFKVIAGQNIRLIWVKENMSSTKCNGVPGQGMAHIA